MPNYRRYRAEGGTFAFTVCLAERGARTLIEEVGPLRASYRQARAERPFATLALCVLPDHLHAVWRLPEGDTDYPARWQAIKARFTVAIGRRVWQPRYWERMVRGPDDLERHVAYVHANPVRHGLVRSMDDWPHSTWHRWKRGYGRAWTPPPPGFTMEWTP